MNSQRLIFALAGLLLLSAFTTALLGARYFFSVRARDRVQSQLNFVQQQRAMVQNLARDTVAYARVNPAIHPILEEFNILQRTTNAPPEPLQETQPQPGLRQ